MLSFKNWIQQEDGNQFLNLTGSESFIQTPVTDTLHAQIDQLHKQAGYKTELENKYIFGIDKRYLLATGVVLVLVGGFLVIKNFKK